MLGADDSWAEHREVAEGRRVERDLGRDDESLLESQGLKVIKHVIPIMPKKVLRRRLQGECRVMFDLKKNGKPHRIHADCTDNAFVRSARGAVRNARFEPVLRDGEKVEVYGVVYPVQYCFGPDIGF